MTPLAIKFLVSGGLLYTLGVPAFMRNKHFDHVIWHAFVLAGSVMIYWSLHLCIEAKLIGTL